MKKYIVLSFIILLVALVASVQRNVQIQKKYDTAVSNMKAYDDLIAGKNIDNHMLSLTIDQLQYSRDSLLNKLDSVRQSAGIKKNDVKEIYYIKSEASKTDSLYFRDSVFVPMVDVDTLIGNKWYSLHVHLKSPNYIQVTPRFTSSKYILTHLSKETVNPPKRCWLLRLLQRKHKVLRVTVIEENPYIKADTARYVEIVR